MKPVRTITARRMSELRIKARALPKEPVGDERCQLIRTGSTILCKGKCDDGTCFLRVSIGRSRITISCRCL